MTAPGLRERNRRDLTRALLDAARAQLAEVGAPALSLRSVAREVGMVPSAVYRYFPSRDHLLTALLIEGYDSLGDAVEAAETSVRAGDRAGRWRAVCSAVRSWGLAHPHEWALLYGSPVPGYAAPADTIGPSARTTSVFGRLGTAIGDHAGPTPKRLPAGLRRELGALARTEFFLDPGAGGPPLSDIGVVRCVGAWVQVFGLVSFELFGQFADTITDLDAFFAAQIEMLYRSLAG